MGGYHNTVIGMSSSVSLLHDPCLRAAAQELNPDMLHRLDGLFAFYHRQWWCHRQMFYHFKHHHNLFNGLALLIMAAGIIVGPILKNSILVACLTAAGVVVKGWNDFKKFSVKVDMCRFAYTTYDKTLIELRSYVCGLPLDDFHGFLINMQTLDDTITDFAPPVSDKCTQEYERRFQYVPSKDGRHSESFLIDKSNSTAV